MTREDTIKTQATEFNESLILDQDVIVTFSGGYDELFSEPPVGMTTVNSPTGPAMTISSGLVITENVILK